MYCWMGQIYPFSTLSLEIFFHRSSNPAVCNAIMFWLVPLEGCSELWLPLPGKVTPGSLGNRMGWTIPFTLSTCPLQSCIWMLRSKIQLTITLVAFVQWVPQRVIRCDTKVWHFVVDGGNPKASVVTRHLPFSSYTWSNPVLAYLIQKIQLTKNSNTGTHDISLALLKFHVPKASVLPFTKAPRFTVVGHLKSPSREDLHKRHTRTETICN